MKNEKFKPLNIIFAIFHFLMQIGIICFIILNDFAANDKLIMLMFLSLFSYPLLIMIGNRKNLKSRKLKEFDPFWGQEFVWSMFFSVLYFILSKLITIDFYKAYFLIVIILKNVISMRNLRKWKVLVLGEEKREED